MGPAVMPLPNKALATYVANVAVPRKWSVRVDLAVHYSLQIRWRSVSDCLGVGRNSRGSLPNPEQLASNGRSAATRNQEGNLHATDHGLLFVIFRRSARGLP
jgi:hypothetical protein